MCTIIGNNGDPKLWILTQIQAWGNNKIMNSSWPFDQQIPPSEYFTYSLYKELYWLPWLLSILEHYTPCFSQSVWMSKPPFAHFALEWDVSMSAILIPEMYRPSRNQLWTGTHEHKNYNMYTLVTARVHKLYSSLWGGRFTHWSSVGNARVLPRLISFFCHEKQPGYKAKEQHSLYDTLGKAGQIGNSGTLVMVTWPACDVLYLAYNMCAYICMREMPMLSVLQSIRCP